MALESCNLFADNCDVVTCTENPDISTESMQESIKLASDWYSKNLIRNHGFRQVRHGQAN